MIFFLTLIYSVFQVSLAGIGGSAGGPGVSSWAPDVDKDLTRDWPRVRLNEDRTYRVDQLCILNGSSLRTLKKTRKFSFQSLSYINYGYKILDRVFDSSNCYVSSDPKCTLVDQYVSEYVSVPVYKGSPRVERGGAESLKSFVRRAKLLRIDQLKVPYCP